MKFSRLAALTILAVLLATFTFAAETSTNVVEGSKLPEISGVDLSGGPITLNAAGKRLVVLSFWSIYCSDCIRELDDLRAIRAEFNDDDLEVVAINTDNSIPVSRIQSFLKRYESVRGTALNVTHILDREYKIIKNLDIKVIPLMITANMSGTVTSVVSGYEHSEDQARLYKVLDQGSVELGSWSEKLRGRLRSFIRSSGVEGQAVEWGSFSVEESMGLFGVYEGGEWTSAITGRRDKGAEKERVEKLVADRLVFSLLREALSNVGVLYSEEAKFPFTKNGVEVFQSPLAQDSKWKKLYTALGFKDLYKLESKSSYWFSDEYHSAFIADVDLGRLKASLKDLEFPQNPSKITIVTTSDFDYKPRALLSELKKRSFRVFGFEGTSVLYYGDIEKLVDELNAIKLEGITTYIEKNETNGVIHIEIF